MAAITFVMKGLSERGIELWRGVLDRDPLCVVCHYSFVMAHVTVDKLESAAMSVEVLVSIAEGVRLSQALNLLGALRLLQGQPDEALRIFEDTRIYEPHRRLGVALALHDLGREADFERTFTELKSHWSTAETKWSEGIVTIYGWSGNLDQAFKLLDDDIESHNHASELYGGMWGPYFRNMRRDPRWQRSSERLAALRAEQATPPLTGSVQE